MRASFGGVRARRSLAQGASVAFAALLALAGRGRRPVQVVDAEADDAIPGLIDVEMEGIAPEHRALFAQLGEVLEDESLPADPLGGIPTSEELLVVRVDPAREAEILRQLRARPDVRFAEPVVRVHAFWQPNDPGFAKQWHLRAAGAPSAWEISRGFGVTVAVLDTGIAPVDDLDAARILRGKDFVRGGDDTRDDHGHGTHVAGTVAQSTGNGVGVAGMAPLARLLPLKVLAADGSGTSIAIADAIRWAADHGARVLNLSLGGGARSAAMEEAVLYARRRGCVVVCAAGNGGSRGVAFPAAYEGAVAVSAVGPDRTLAPYSSFGPEIRIAAPGGDKRRGEEGGVLQETIDPQDPRGKGVYRYYQGTSMAAPHVAGAVALLAAVGVTNPAAVERLLTATARAAPDQAGDGSAERYGAGLLDVAGALRRATLIWGLERLLLALLGAWVALAHARRLGQIRRGRSMGRAFWTALAVGSGALGALAPLGLARLVVAAALALPPAAMSARFFGLPGTGWLASLAAYLSWSALLPFLIALVARARPFADRLAPAAAGLAFGWAGMLLHAALARSVFLPVLPPALVPVYLLGGAALAWLAGRGLLATEVLIGRKAAWSTIR